MTPGEERELLMMFMLVAWEAIWEALIAAIFACVVAMFWAMAAEINCSRWEGESRAQAARFLA